MGCEFERFPTTRVDVCMGLLGAITCATVGPNKIPPLLAVRVLLHVRWIVCSWLDEVRVMRCP